MSLRPRDASHDLRAYVCPLDGGELAWGSGEDGSVVVCEHRQHRFEVVDSVPRFVAAGPPVSRRSSQRFGYKWQVFHEINEDYVRNFLDEIRPLDETFFRGKLILDAGCGIGIPSYCLSRMGPRRISAADVSPAASTRTATTASRASSRWCRRTSTGCPIATPSSTSSSASRCCSTCPITWRPSTPCCSGSSRGAR